MTEKVTSSTTNRKRYSGGFLESLLGIPGSTVGYSLDLRRQNP